MNAHGGSSRWGRLALVAVAVIVAGTLALPAAALAKTVTRLVVAKTVTVDNGDPGTTAWPKALTVKLQKRITSTHYHALTGTVKVYLYDVDDEAYYFVMSRKGSTISFPIPGRGKYKFVYAGSGTMRSCAAYSTLIEDIGYALATNGVSVTAVSGSATQSWVTLSYTVGWNTNAWDDRLWFGSDMWFGNTEAESLYYERWLKGPGTVEFTFKVNNVDILPHLFDDAWAYVDKHDDPYVAESSDLENVYDMPAID
jgi:hypothetical protein